MNAIETDIRDAIKKELAAANERFPLFSSMHEAIAVIAEERDEAAAEMENVTRHLQMMWTQVKLNNKTALQCLARTKYDAEKLAIEACQIAAMCEKCFLSIADKEEKKQC